MLYPYLQKLTLFIFCFATYNGTWPHGHVPLETAEKVKQRLEKIQHKAREASPAGAKRPRQAERVMCCKLQSTSIKSAIAEHTSPT